jgi:hypothetical protein
MTRTEMRKWTAAVTVAGVDVTDLLDQSYPPNYVTGTGLSDTLKVVTDAAVALAARLIREEYGSDASVTLFKQLKNQPEPVRDRSVYVYRDWNRNGDAVIRVQR